MPMTPQPEPTPGNAPIPGPTPMPTPTPIQAPTPGPLPLDGSGHPVASVEIIGQPVAESGPLSALHLAEVITYKDGTRPDIVGYDPEGRGFAHGGDPLFAERSLGHATPEAYIAAGRERYSLKIEAPPGQTLDTFVARQEQAWKRYDAGANVPRYDFAGNDTGLHNSNSAMVASVEHAGRPDVANQLRRDLEPPAQMRRLESWGLSPEAAGMALVVERRLEGQPSAPGSSRELAADQINGTATAAPQALTNTVGSREVGSAFRALASEISHLPQSFGERLIEKRDLLSIENARTGRTFPAIRTAPDGSQSIQELREPFTQSGTIVRADADRITQSIGRGHTFTYRTEDVLRGAPDASAQLRILENAASNHESIGLTVGPTRTEIGNPGQERNLQNDRGR